MFYNFGLEKYLGLAIYCAGIGALLISIFWRPIAGIYYLVPLIPLQTTRYRMMEYPLGPSVVNIILIGVALGLLRQRQWFVPRTPWTLILLLTAAYNLGSVFLDPNYLEPRFREWWNYIAMPVLFFLVTCSVKTTHQMKFIMLLMCLSVFVMDKSFWDAIKDRDYSTFSRSLQEGGSMGYAGVQGLAAFNAQYAWFLVALLGSQTSRVVRLALIALALFAANCVMYSFSRGGYVAFLAGWLFIGVVKYRKLLVLLLVLSTTWVSLVPTAVQERVLMTYDSSGGELDHSAALRLELWGDAINLFQSNPVLGTGYNTYAYMKRLYDYEDTHNIYLKVLVETGIVGLLLLLWLMAKTFGAGYQLFRRAKDPFFSSIGLGLSAWMVCAATASLFGDRWTYLQISGFLWVLAGFAARAMMLESSSKEEGETVISLGTVAVAEPA